jgi:DNA-binding MarR family transcriptional regulator
VTGHTEEAGDAGRALDALRRIVRALRVSSRAVERDVGISGAQLFVLRHLAAAPRQSLNDLVARTLTHQSSVSEVVSRLVERGFVSRRAAADDARRAELQITARGRAVLRSAPPTLQSALLDGLARLPAAQRRALADGLGAWIEASGLAAVEPTMFFEVPSGGRGDGRSNGRHPRTRTSSSSDSSNSSSSSRATPKRGVAKRGASKRGAARGATSRRSKRVDG